MSSWHATKIEELLARERELDRRQALTGARFTSALGLPPSVSAADQARAVERVMEASARQ